MYNWRLLAAGFWGFLALAMSCRSLLLDAEALDRLPVRNWSVGILVSVFLCLWNVARWFQARSQERDRLEQRYPLQPNPDAKPGYEYNPELDFQKMDRENRGS